MQHLDYFPNHLNEDFASYADYMAGNPHRRIVGWDIRFTDVGLGYIIEVGRPHPTTDKMYSVISVEPIPEDAVQFWIKNAKADVDAKILKESGTTRDPNAIDYHERTLF